MGVVYPYHIENCGEKRKCWKKSKKLITKKNRENTKLDGKRSNKNIKREKHEHNKLLNKQKKTKIQKEYIKKNTKLFRLPAESNHNGQSIWYWIIWGMNWNTKNMKHNKTNYQSKEMNNTESRHLLYGFGT